MESRRLRAELISSGAGMSMGIVYSVGIKGKNRRMGMENMQNTGGEDYKEQMTRKVGIQGTANIS